MRADGDHDAGRLDEFAASQHPRLVSLLTLHVGDRYTAEELAQDAIVRLCQHWPRVRGMDEPQAWLTRVALNLAASGFRRRAAERRAVSRVGTGRDAVDPVDTAAAVAARRALMALPRRQRTVLVLRFYEDLSVAETARLMGCAEGTVKSLTSKATAALRADPRNVDNFESEEVR